MDEDPILVEKRDGYRVITLNRPAAGSTPSPSRCIRRSRPRSPRPRATKPAARCCSPARAAHSCSGQDLQRARAAVGRRSWCRAKGLKKYFNPLVLKLRALPFPVVVCGERHRGGCGPQRRARLRRRAGGDGPRPSRRCSRRSVSFPMRAARGSCRGWSARRGPRAWRCWPSRSPAEKAEQWGPDLEGRCRRHADGGSRKLCADFARGPTVAYGLIKRALDAAEEQRSGGQLDLEAQYAARGRQHRRTTKGAVRRVPGQAEAGVHGQALAR